MNIEFIETEIQILINNYKEKCFTIESTDNLEEKINENFTKLESLRKFIIERLKIKKDEFPPLLSKIYIDNRRKIRKENDQYRKEILAKTQCLKENNDVFIDPNYDIDVLGFNKVPWIHFKFIGLSGTEENPGIYKIKIPENLPFGLLYDFEEYPNKKYSYDVEEKSLEITGTELVKTDTITEDKWINAPGDVDDDDKFDSLLNVGPQDFTVKFYTGEITLKVTGNFGVVSYYIKDKGYMGGQKRLKFSELCIINNG